MELLLNIIWLALAVPALWMWRQKAKCVQHPQWLGRYRPFILLGCALLLLFPVVSATDDLNAMRPEMEDSNPSTRPFKHSAGARSNLSTHATGIVPSQHVGARFVPPDESCGLVWISSAGLPKSVPVDQSVSRGPPVGVLS
jgi:hypothetical protein